jgi:hypothetical protein
VLRFPELDDRTFSALWPACVGALAALYAGAGDGAWTRRSAIGWMMGAWGARLAVQALYTRASGVPNLPALPLRPSYLKLLTLSLFFSLPALLASRNAEPVLSFTEMAAGAVWVIAFTGETTADHEVCEVLLWTSLALFASASPWGWVTFACPAVILFHLLALTRRAPAA